MSGSGSTRRSAGAARNGSKGSNQRFHRGLANVWLRLGFRTPAQRAADPGKGRGPASESLRKTNPRDSGEQLAVYGELVGQRRWWGMVLRRLVRAESS